MTKEQQTMVFVCEADPHTNDFVAVGRWLKAVYPTASPAFLQRSSKYSVLAQMQIEQGRGKQFNYCEVAPPNATVESLVLTARRHRGKSLVVMGNEQDCAALLREARWLIGETVTKKRIEPGAAIAIFPGSAQ